MKLIFRGHDFRYAVEQSLLAFFPDQRPVYDGEDSDAAIVTLSAGRLLHTAATTLTVGGRTAQGISRIEIPAGTDPYEQERLKQRIVKLSFFKAARSITGVTPAWGALTGIRPAKLAAGLLEEGKSEAETDRILRNTYSLSSMDEKKAFMVP